MLTPPCEKSLVLQHVEVTEFISLVLQAEQKDRVLSTSEDSLQCLHNSKADPVIRSRPLSDLFPFQSHAERSAVPYLLSGCSAQVQPMTAGSLTDENRLNGINSSAWSNPVIAQPEGKPHSSRIMRLFSSSRKGAVSAQNPSTDSPTSAYSNDSSSSAQSWSGLQGLGVMDSFKKLRSSVLQGIQSKGATNHDGELGPTYNHEMANGRVVNHIDPQLDDAANHLKIAEGVYVSNGSTKLAGMSEFGSDIEDYDDEENDDGDSLQRNSRFSRSIRRAYGPGRISLLDMGNGRIPGKSTDEAVDTQKADQNSKVNAQTENMSENTNVKVLSRLSKSAENLHIFKAPFRRKAPSPGHPSHQADSQRMNASNGSTNIQRTASASSVDLRGHAGSCRKNPVKAKGQMLKLVGSMTDLTIRHKRSPSSSPTSPPPMSPLTRLHDDYSRRVPCLTASERQRRPSPIRARVMSVEHNPLIHLESEHVTSQQHQVVVPVSLEPPERTEETLPKTSVLSHSDSFTVAIRSGYKWTENTEVSSSMLGQEALTQSQEQSEFNSLSVKVRE